ncbi:MAG: hypothetical protein R3200_15480 [Xanthomonadales bacterium]|nr:hypothetical protein [Xanthomonadales bacterium]
MARNITKGVEQLLAETNAQITTIPVDEALAQGDHNIPRNYLKFN